MLWLKKGVWGRTKGELEEIRGLSAGGGFEEGFRLDLCCLLYDCYTVHDRVFSFKESQIMLVLASLRRKYFS